MWADPDWDLPFHYTEDQGIAHKFHTPVLLCRTSSFKPQIISTCLRALFCQFFHGKSSCYLQRQKLLPAEKSSAVLARKEHCSRKHNLVAFQNSWARISSSLAVLKLQFCCRNSGTRQWESLELLPSSTVCMRRVQTADWISVLAPQPWHVGAIPAINPMQTFLTAYSWPLQSLNTVWRGAAPEECFPALCLRKTAQLMPCLAIVCWAVIWLQWNVLYKQKV